MQHSLVEQCLAMLTPVADGLLLGCAAALSSANCLCEQGISHVVLLCCGPEVCTTLN